MNPRTFARLRRGASPRGRSREGRSSRARRRGAFARGHPRAIAPRLGIRFDSAEGPGGSFGEARAKLGGEAGARARSGPRPTCTEARRSTTGRGVPSFDFAEPCWLVRGPRRVDLGRVGQACAARESERAGDLAWAPRKSRHSCARDPRAHSRSALARSPALPLSVRPRLTRTFATGPRALAQIRAPLRRLTYHCPASPALAQAQVPFRWLTFPCAGSPAPAQDHVPLRRITSPCAGSRS